MILYQLRCTHGHDFEAWFRDGASYDDQQEAGAVACPYCGTSSVVKAPMAPAIAGRRDGHPDDREGAERRANEVAERILETVDGLSERIEDECDYVGDDFAEEARRIHYGESDDRGIWGEATDDEADELDDEGIEVFRLPFLRRRGR